MLRAAYDNSEKEGAFKNEVRQEILSQTAKESEKGWLDLCCLA